MTDRAEPKEIPLEDLRESKFNHRRNWNLEELVPSIFRHGVLQPLLARNTASGLELVYGARRFRAAKKAGLETVPVEVRDLDDTTTRELIAVENGQREDVHPLDEAELYAEIRDKDGVTGDEIAAKVGKSRSWVYGRLALADLCPAAKKALAEDELSASVGVELARIHAPALQKKATADLLRMATENAGALSVRHARDHITSQYLLRLKEAPFDLADEKLVPKAGACANCPKRTGNQVELFAEIAGPDVCTDPPCFNQKRDAQWAAMQAEAKESGRQVLSKKEAAKTFSPYLTYKGEDRIDYDADFVMLDDRCADDPKGRTYKKLLAGKNVPTVLARSPKSGAIHELLPRKGLSQVLRDAGVKIPKGSQPARREASRSEQLERKKKKLQRMFESEVLGALVERVEGGGVSADIWKGLAHGAVRNVWHDLSKDTVRRRSLGEKGDRPEEVLHREIEKNPTAWSMGLVVELLTARGITWALFKERNDQYNADKFPSTVEALSKSLGISIPRLKSGFQKRLARVPKPAKKKATRKKKATAKTAKKKAAKRKTKKAASKKSTKRKTTKKASRK